MTNAKSLLLLSLCTSIGACTSPNAHFYALTDTTPSSTNTPTAPYYLRVDPVELPDLINKPQWVMQQSNGQVRILELTRWASPLDEQIRQLISQNLTTQLHTIDTYALNVTTKQPIYRIKIVLSRFTLSPDTPLELNAQWKIHQKNQTLICKSHFSQQAGHTPLDILQTQRTLLEKLSQQIAQAIQQINATGTKNKVRIACPDFH